MPPANYTARLIDLPVWPSDVEAPTQFGLAYFIGVPETDFVASTVDVRIEITNSGVDEEFDVELVVAKTQTFEGDVEVVVGNPNIVEFDAEIIVQSPELLDVDFGMRIYATGFPLPPSDTDVTMDIVNDTYVVDTDVRIIITGTSEAEGDAEIIVVEPLDDPGPKRTLSGWEYL